MMTGLNVCVCGGVQMTNTRELEDWWALRGPKVLGERSSISYRPYTQGGAHSKSQKQREQWFEPGKEAGTQWGSRPEFMEMAQWQVGA